MNPKMGRKLPVISWPNALCKLRLLGGHIKELKKDLSRSGCRLVRVPAALGRVLKGLRVPDLGVEKDLGRALGHFIFSFIGLKRILFY